MDTILDLVVIAARFIVGLWPVMFLALLIGIFKRGHGFGAALRISTKALMISWGFFALLHLTFFFLKMDTFHLISEPLNSRLLLCTGLLLMPFAFAIALEERHKRSTANSIEEMRALSPSEFEKLVADTYRDQGHAVEIVGGTGDHGIDIVVHSHRGETWFIQCKRYKGKIGEPVVRDFYGALRSAEADGGAIITTGTITDSARLWAEGKPIHLYDGEQFLKIVRSTRNHKADQEPQMFGRRKTDHRPQVLAPALAAAGAAVGAAASSVMETAAEVFGGAVLAPAERNNFTAEASSATGNSTASYGNASAAGAPDKRPFMNINEPPDCPVCAIPMVLKTVKHGLGRTREMYVCTNSPQCRVTLPKE